MVDVTKYQLYGNPHTRVNIYQLEPSLWSLSNKKNYADTKNPKPVYSDAYNKLPHQTVK